MDIPVDLILWAYVAAYAIHILDESLLGETFVGMVRREFWPAYERRHFVAFNGVLMSLVILSVALFEWRGGAWIVLPLTFVVQMVTNGLWHLVATLVTRRYSPGLLTSGLYWMLFYFLCRQAFLNGGTPMPQFVIAGILGTLMTVLMIGSLFLFRRRRAPATRDVGTWQSPP